MTFFVRRLPHALALLLVAACAQDQPAAPLRSTASPPEANTWFAMFMNDPTNRDSWRWLCRAATGGQAAAQYIVGVRYRDGLPPVTQNLPRAFRWFTAAQKGGLTAAALAREEVGNRLPEDAVARLQKGSEPLTTADCRADRTLVEKNPS